MGGLIEIGGIEINAIDAVLYAWFLLAGASTAYVAWDNFVRKNPEETVMKWGWVLITLYMGPVALALYVMADKEPRPGEHEEFIRPLWKQGVGSTVHCIAGDATGIITAAVITAALGLPMWVDLAVEYTAGYWEYFVAHVPNDVDVDSRYCPDPILHNLVHLALYTRCRRDAVSIRCCLWCSVPDSDLSCLSILWRSSRSPCLYTGSNSCLGVGGVPRSRAEGCPLHPACSRRCLCGGSLLPYD